MRNLTHFKRLTFCLLLTATMAVQAQTLQGKWTVEKVTIEKNTDGKMDSTVYPSVEAVKDYTTFPQVLDVKDAKTLLMRYADATEEMEADYTLEDGVLRITYNVLGFSYLYSLNADTLVLTSYPFVFVEKTQAGEKKMVTAKWIFTLKKVNNELS